MYTACGGQVREIESLLYRVRRKKEAEKEKRKRKRKEKTKKKKARKEEKTDIPSDQSSAAITRVSGLACKEAGTSWSLRRGLLSD